MPDKQPGSWKWLSFQAHHTQRQAFSFVINNRFEPGSERLDEHRMLYKPLNTNTSWRTFDWHRHDPSAGTYTFGNHAPCKHEAIQVAYGVTYSPDDCWAWLNNLHDQSLIRPTPASNAQYAIGHTAPGIDDLDRAWPAMPIPAFRMGIDPKHAHTKHIVLMAGVHPNEGPANWVLQGAVQALTTSPILEQATIDIYPMVNPAGRTAGLNRTTLQHTDRDSNRVWRENLYHDMVDIRLVAEAIQTNLNGQAPDLFIDFHAWCDPRKQPFGILRRADGFDQHPFWKKLTALEPKLGLMDSGWQNPSTETWAYQTLKAKFCMTFETTFRADWLEPQLTQLGHKIAQAINTGLDS